MTDHPPTCGFCLKKANEVETLIAGPTSFICNECIDICNDVLLERKIKKALQRIVSDKPLRFPTPSHEGASS